MVEGDCSQEVALTGVVVEEEKAVEWMAMGTHL